jgi:O-antigen/teichoic acid export membrane protein
MSRSYSLLNIQLATINLDTARRVAPRVLRPFLDRIEQSAEGRRMLRGMFWSFAGAVSSRAIGLLASIIVARILGKRGFGELGIVQSTSNMYLTFAQFGLTMTVTKYVAEFRRTDPERAGRTIAMSAILAVVSGCIMGVVMVATSGWAARLLAAPHLKLAIAISAAALLLITTNEAQNGVLNGLEAFRRRSRIQFVAAIASFPVTVVGAFTFGLIGAVYGLIASQALILVLTQQAVQKETSAAGISIRWKEFRQEAGLLMRFSLPMLLVGAVYMPSTWIANMILVNTPSGYAEMGVFSAADRWRTAILFLPGLLGGVTLPMLSSLQSKADSDKYHNLLWANIKFSVLASLAVATPVALCAPWIMSSYGPGFREGTWVLITLCTTAVGFAAYWIVNQSLLSRGHVMTIFYINLGWAVTLLTVEWLLRGQGARGLALAYLLAEAGRVTASLIYANRTRNTGLSDRPIRSEDAAIVLERVSE